MHIHRHTRTCIYAYISFYVCVCVYRYIHAYSDRPITREEVKEALRKMKSGKAIGPDSIPVRFGNLWVRTELLG